MTRPCQPFPSISIVQPRAGDPSPFANLSVTSLTANQTSPRSGGPSPLKAKFGPAISIGCEGEKSASGRVVASSGFIPLNRLFSALLRQASEQNFFATAGRVYRIAGKSPVSSHASLRGVVVVSIPQYCSPASPISAARCGHFARARVRARSLCSAAGRDVRQALPGSGSHETIGSPSAPAQPLITPRARPKAKAATFASVGRAPKSGTVPVSRAPGSRQAAARSSRPGRWPPGETACPRPQAARRFRPA